MDDSQRREAAERFSKGESPTALARAYNVSRSTIYRLPRPETFQALGKGAAMTEYGVSGLNRFGGSVQEDFLRPWKTLDKMVATVKEMMEHPIVAATLFAIEMAIRGAEWNVTPAGSEDADQEAADFLKSCMDDLSHTWDDHVTQALSFVPFGFSPFEIIYKRRLGLDKDPSSSFDDGRIGWRKFAFRSQDTLAPGNEWVFDENGGVQGMNQSAPPDYKAVTIPIEKMILYRTTSAKNNPQGRSMLRGAYSAWYYAKNFAEIEGISAERLGAGFPVMYLGKETQKGGANSDLEFAKNAVRDIRVDDQMGLVIPHQKMGADGIGVLFEFAAPDGSPPIDFDKAIQRYNQQIAQVTLAQFIFFGLTERGTQALAVRTTDFFTQAIAGWLESMAETMNLYAVPRLFRLNAPAFLGMTAFPKIAVGPIGQVNVKSLIEAINAAVTAGVVTPSPADETHIRQLLELPEKEEAEESEEVEKGETPEGTAKPGLDSGEEGDQAKLDELAKSGEEFADTRGAGAQRLRTWERETNAYQQALAAEYARWSRQLATDLEGAEDEEEQDEIITTALAALTLSLRRMGRENVIGGMTLGLGERPPTPQLLQEIAAQTQSNDLYIEGSLVPSLRDRLREALRDPEIVASGSAAILGVLTSMNARVESYAGGMWGAIQSGVGDVSRQAGEAGADERVYWEKDQLAKHCEDCLEHGDKEYESYDAMLAETGGKQPGAGVRCGSNCRCKLMVWGGDGWVRP